MARSYAETLFELAGRHEGPELYGFGIQMIAGFMEDAKVMEFFCTPRISAAAKKSTLDVLAARSRFVNSPSLPPMLVNFLKVVIDKRRQRLLPGIAKEYTSILNRHQGRRHMDVTVARPLDQSTTDELAERLSLATGATVIPRVTVRPEILGGIVIRESDILYDGSLKRQLDGMRRRLLAVRLPEQPARDSAEVSAGTAT